MNEYLFLQFFLVILFSIKIKKFITCPLILISFPKECFYKGDFYDVGESCYDDCYMQECQMKHPYHVGPRWIKTDYKDPGCGNGYYPGHLNRYSNRYLGQYIKISVRLAHFNNDKQKMCIFLLKKYDFLRKKYNE